MSERAGAAALAPVSAVIVNYDAGAHLLRCVASLRAAGVGEVVVVDNGSHDGSAEAAVAADPGVRLVPTGANLGYGSAANRGAVVAGGEALLVLNPDVVVAPDAPARLFAALSVAPRRGVVGPRIDTPAGARYPSPRTFPALGDALGHAFVGLVFPANRWSRRYKRLDAEPAAGPVDWVSGACLLARRACFEALGGFDEAYFMYAEDVDLCWRAWRAGFEVAYEPAARVAHVQGVSADQRPYRMIAAHHRSLLRFSARTTTGWRRALLPVVAVGLAARAALACAKRAWPRRADLPAARGEARCRGVRRGAE